MQAWTTTFFKIKLFLKIGEQSNFQIRISNTVISNKDRKYLPQRQIQVPAAFEWHWWAQGGYKMKLVSYYYQWPTM